MRSSLPSRVRPFSARIVAAILSLSLSAGWMGSASAAVSVVSRGDFLRAAISALNIRLETDRDLPYTNVPSALIPYVQTAEQRGALDLLAEKGTIDWTKAVTRGEAIDMTRALLGGQPKRALTRTFTDVKTDAAKEDVALALEGKWLRPLRSSFFGWARPLSATDERAILKNAQKGTVTILPPAGATIRVSPQTPSSLPKEEILQTVWDLLDKQYLYEDRIKPNEAGYKSAEALVQTLNDPYTVFYRPSSTKDFQTQLQGELTGIGAQVEQKAGVLTVVAPLKGSPAEKAGLQAGDEILSVNNESLAGLSYEDAVNKVRGPRGTVARLHINRGGAALDVAVTRDTITIADMDVSEQGSVAIIALHQFGTKTETQFLAQMRDIAAKNPTGVILDLRNNPGGLLDAAGTVVSAFVPAKTTFVKIHTKTGETEEKTQDDPIFPASTRLVVIVNKGSASAAEIVAGALQDLKRGTIIGEKTFGKGTVQQLLEFNDGSSLKMTIAEWTTPDGNKIDGVGVKPDIEVPADSTRDAPLAKALDLLR